MLLVRYLKKKKHPGHHLAGLKRSQKCSVKMVKSLRQDLTLKEDQSVVAHSVHSRAVRDRGRNRPDSVHSRLVRDRGRSKAVSAHSRVGRVKDQLMHSVLNRPDRPDSIQLLARKKLLFQLRLKILQKEKR